MALPATDTFSQSSGSTQALSTYSANWTVIVGSIDVPSGGNRYQPSGGTYNTAYWDADTFNADHYSQVVITAAQLSAGTYAGPAVRCQVGADTSYHVDCNGSATYLSGDSGGTHPISQDISGDVGTLVAGDVLRLTVEGTTNPIVLKVYVASFLTPTTFVLKHTYNDTSVLIPTAGYAGIFAYGNLNGGPTNWEGGNLGSPPAGGFFAQYYYLNNGVRNV